MEIERVLTQFAGISGFGKSFLVKNNFIPEMAKYQPVIIFDKNQEYAGTDAVDMPEKYPYYNSIQHFLKELKDMKTLKGVNVIHCKKPSDYDYGIRFFDSLGEPVCLILDEGHWIFGEPKLKHLSEVIKNIARFGRHKGISLVLISQRVMDIPPNVRSQFTGVVSFRQNEPSDVDSLKKKGWEGAERVLDFDRQEFEIFGELPTQIKKALKNGKEN